MYKILGIPNCSSVKKARNFFDENEIEYEFRDLRKQELNEKEWKNLVDQDHDEKLINTRGPSFRKMNVDKSDLNPQKKLELLLDMPTVMKRPVILKANKIQAIGFSEQEYQELF